MGNEANTEIRLYGVNQDGNSVCAHVYNFRPYFYAELNTGTELSDDL